MGQKNIIHPSFIHRIRDIVGTELSTSVSNLGQAIKPFTMLVIALKVNGYSPL